MKMKDIKPLTYNPWRCPECGYMHAHKCSGRDFDLTWYLICQKCKAKWEATLDVVSIEVTQKGKDAE